MDIQNVQCKAAVTHLELHTTRVQWVCLEAENSAIVTTVKCLGFILRWGTQQLFMKKKKRKKSRIRTFQLMGQEWGVEVVCLAIRKTEGTYIKGRRLTRCHHKQTCNMSTLLIWYRRVKRQTSGQTYSVSYFGNDYLWDGMSSWSNCNCNHCPSAAASRGRKGNITTLPSASVLTKAASIFQDVLKKNSNAPHHSKCLFCCYFFSFLFFCFHKGPV